MSNLERIRHRRFYLFLALTIGLAILAPVAVLAA
jgi:hypothetical protein